MESERGEREAEESEAEEWRGEAVRRDEGQGRGRMNEGGEGGEGIGWKQK